MVAKGEAFMIYRKKFCRHLQNKYGLPKKEYVKVIDVKHYGLEIETFLADITTSWALVFYVDAHVCTISKVTGIIEEKEIFLPTGNT